MCCPFLRVGAILSTTEHQTTGRNNRTEQMTEVFNLMCVQFVHLGCNVLLNVMSGLSPFLNSIQSVKRPPPVGSQCHQPAAAATAARCQSESSARRRRPVSVRVSQPAAAARCQSVNNIIFSLTIILFFYKSILTTFFFSL